MFVDDKVVGLRLELVHDIRVPGVAGQNPTFSAGRGMHTLPDAERQVSETVRRIGSTQVREVRPTHHVKMNDLDARLASRHQDSCGGAAGLLNAGNINSS